MQYKKDDHNLRHGQMDVINHPTYHARDQVNVSSCAKIISDGELRKIYIGGDIK
jgi:hypothetical protein